MTCHQPAINLIEDTGSLELVPLAEAAWVIKGLYNPAGISFLLKPTTAESGIPRGLSYAKHSDLQGEMLPHPMLLSYAMETHVTSWALKNNRAIQRPESFPSMLLQYLKGIV